jgi:hypothetical protein
MADNHEYYIYSRQEKISEDTNTWNIHQQNDTLYSFARLDSLEGGYLYISMESQVKRVLIHEIDEIESTKENESDGMEITGLLGGALIGGALGFLVAPKGTLFGKTFIPDAEKYIAVGAVVGGSIGYFTMKSSQQEIYRFEYITYPEKVSILKSLIKDD